MRKYLLTLLLALGISIPAYAAQITVDDIITPDDLTISWINSFKSTVIDAINNADGGNLIDGTVTATKLDANANPVNRWNEAFEDWVYTGLLPPTTSGTLTSTTTAGTAYIDGERVVKDATAHTYSATKWTYVDLSSNGTYTYVETAVDIAEPATTTDSIRLARVVTDGTEVTSVRDDRVTAATLGTSEDFYIKGFEITMDAAFDVVTIDAGFLRHGSTNVRKTSEEGIELDVAADWHDGAIDNYAAEGWCYIGIKSTGGFKYLGTNAPDYTDISGNTDGIKYYWYDGANYWRVIFAVRVDANNNMLYDFVQQEKTVMYAVPRNETTTVSDNTWSAAQDCSDCIPAISTMGIFGLKAQEDDAATAAIWIRPNGTTWVTDAENGTYIDTSGGTAPVIGMQRQCMTDSSQQIQYFNNTGDSGTSIDIEGFILNIR